ncbi:MAG: mechanosensitive ion channel [Clostridia bacterium]|nr:mechanosensitive ion channel [Clostridia bacterium]
MPQTIQTILDTLGSQATSLALRLVGAVLILVIGLKLSNWIVKKLGNNKGFQKMDASIEHFLLSAFKIMLYAVVIISAAGTLGIPATSFITILASAGVAIGLALQGSLSNIAGSIMILFFRPYKIGDFVECAGVSGVVEDINLFYTVIATGDNKTITCPNGTVSNGVITNYSTKDQRRVDITFSASYGSDIEKVKAVILDCVKAQSLALNEPAPFVGVVAQSASSIDFVCRVWVNSADYWTVYFALMEGVKQAFDQNGIEIPFPQMDVHVKND